MIVYFKYCMFLLLNNNFNNIELWMIILIDFLLDFDYNSAILFGNVVQDMKSNW